jgi:NADH-quinone oxidoreductase subunit D
LPKANSQKPKATMKDNQLSNILSQYDSQEQIDGQLYTLNLGPTHPATHGIFQNILTMDGERILHSEQTVGYIHRAFEKIAERRILTKLLHLQTVLIIVLLLSIIWDGI